MGKCQGEIDRIHWFLLIGLFPVILYLYQNVTNSLIDLGKLQANITAASVVISTPGEWYA